MRVEWADEARSDLCEILVYIESVFNTEAAQRALDGINGSIQRLKQYPFLGKLFLDDSLFNISYRVLSSKHNQLVYYLEWDSLIIVAIWDNRKDPEQLKKRLTN